MAFPPRKGRVEMLTVATKKVFAEYADDTQEELMKHSYNSHVSEAIASLRKLLREWSEFGKLYERTRVPSIQQNELLEMYDAKRSQMWTSLLASFRTLALQVVYFEKDPEAMRNIAEVFTAMPQPFGLEMPGKLEDLMFSEVGTMDVEEDLF